MAYVLRTIRLMLDEFDAIKTACAALGQEYAHLEEERRPKKGKEDEPLYPQSNLLQDALSEAVHQLGIYAGTRTPKKPDKPWPWIPDRGDESTSARITISMPPLLNDQLAQAAELVGVPETLFLVGATLRYIGRLQKVYPDNKTLQAIRLQPHYR